jgi:hypothetical protein
VKTLVLKLVIGWAWACALAPMQGCKSSDDSPTEKLDPAVAIGCGNGGFWEVIYQASDPGTIEVKDSGTFTWSSSTSAGCHVATTTAWCSPKVSGTEITWAAPAGARLVVDGACVQASTHGTALWDEATCPMSAAWTGCP